MYETRIDHVPEWVRVSDRKKRGMPGGAKLDVDDAIISPVDPNEYTEGQLEIMRLLKEQPLRTQVDLAKITRKSVHAINACLDRIKRKQLLKTKWDLVECLKLTEEEL